MWCKSLPVARLQTSSKKNRLSTPVTLSSTYFIIPNASTVKSIGETGKPYGLAAPTWCLSITLPFITIVTVLSVGQLEFHRMRTPSIPWPLIVWISLPLTILGNAASMSI